LPVVKNTYDVLERQPNKICEDCRSRLRGAFRTKVYNPIEELQSDLDGWLKKYKETRPHSGKFLKK
jgi:hypothetical protein